MQGQRSAARSPPCRSGASSVVGLELSRGVPLRTSVGGSAAPCTTVMKRLCDLFSYPHRHIHELVKDTNKRARLRPEFQRTIDVYNTFIAAEGKGKVQNIVMSIHPLGTTPGKRAMLAYAEGKPNPMEDLEEIISEMAQGMSHKSNCGTYHWRPEELNDGEKLHKGQEARDVHGHGAGAGHLGRDA